jgi:small-conductance mechanosensitive channel
MGKTMKDVKKKVRKQKAAAEGKLASVETKMALQDTAKSLRYLSDALAEQVREAKLDERAGELAARVRDSEAVAKTQARAEELAGQARAKLHESGLDAKALELAERIRTAESTQQAVETARRVSDDVLDRVGEWLSTGTTAQRLGVQRSKRRFPVWLLGLLGVAAGYAIGMLTAGRRGKELRQDMAMTARQIGEEARETAVDVRQAAAPLVDEVRSRLTEDPRTAALPDLTINIAEGTVFIRGPVPEGVDENTIRDVITAIPGVEDVDLQLVRG